MTELSPPHAHGETNTHTRTYMHAYKHKHGSYCYPIRSREKASKHRPVERQKRNASIGRKVMDGEVHVIDTVNLGSQWETF